MRKGGAYRRIGDKIERVAHTAPGAKAGLTGEAKASPRAPATGARGDDRAGVAPEAPPLGGGTARSQEGSPRDSKARGK
jgi:hypothetical protein